MSEYLARASEEEAVRWSLAALDALTTLRQRVEQEYGHLPASDSPRLATRNTLRWPRRWVAAFSPPTYVWRIPRVRSEQYG